MSVINSKSLLSGKGPDRIHGYFSPTTGSLNRSSILKGRPSSDLSYLSVRSRHQDMFRLVTQSNQFIHLSTSLFAVAQVGTRTLPMGDLGDDLGQDSYLQLPSGLLLQELPPAYFRERDWYARRSSSPSDSGVMSPESWHDELDRFGDRHNESGIGSGVDSVGGTKVYCC